MKLTTPAPSEEIDAEDALHLRCVGEGIANATEATLALARRIRDIVI